MLVAARDSGAVPIVILTKADLSTRFDAVVADTVERARGVEVFATSAEARDGLEHLRERIGPGQTLALLGPSGAGKSSLINALASERRQDTGDVRAGDGRGRRTTTARELVPLGGGTVVMDTPGLRWLSYRKMERELASLAGRAWPTSDATRSRSISSPVMPRWPRTTGIGSGRADGAVTVNGASCRIRTDDPRFTRAVLWPTELRRRADQASARRRRSLGKVNAERSIRVAQRPHRGKSAASFQLRLGVRGTPVARPLRARTDRVSAESKLLRWSPF